jgi:hypothetical protein
VASNGGLVMASPGAGSVVAAFRPSQDLSYSPLATTHNNGTAWTPGLLDAALADVPDALTAAPGGGHLLALLASGQVQLSGPGGTAWARLATHRSVAPSAAGSRCGPASLTAVAFSPAGVPLLAAGCTRPGTAAIFAYAGGTWHPAGPALPARYAHQIVTVLRLTTAGGTTTALLAAGTGPAAQLLAAWSTGGAHWSLSQPLPLHGAKLTSASPGPGGSVAIVLSGTTRRPSPARRAHGGRCPRCRQARQHSHRNLPAAGTRSPSTAPGSPSGSSRPATPPGPPPRPSVFSSSSGHRADASTRADLKVIQAMLGHTPRDLQRAASRRQQNRRLCAPPAQPRGALPGANIRRSGCFGIGSSACPDTFGGIADRE